MATASVVIRRQSSLARLRRKSSLAALDRRESKPQVAGVRESLKLLSEMPVEAAERLQLEQEYGMVDTMMALDKAAAQLHRVGTADFSLPTLLNTTPRLRDSPDAKKPQLPKKLPAVKRSASASGRSKKEALTSDVLSFKPQEAQHKVAQLETFKVLATSLDRGRSLADVLFALTKNVRNHRGTKIFTHTVCRELVAKSLGAKGLQKEPALDDQTVFRIDMVTDAVNIHAEDAHLAAEDIMGQVLWEHRKSPAFLAKKKYREAAADLSWLQMGRVSLDSKKLAIDVVFAELSNQNKLMDSKGWQQVARLVGRCNTLSSRVAQVDVDRLWYLSNKEGPSKNSINKSEFRALLLHWSDVMDVHPWWVFYTLETHAHNGTTCILPNECKTSPKSHACRRAKSVSSACTSAASSPPQSRPTTPFSDACSTAVGGSPQQSEASTSSCGSSPTSSRAASPCSSFRSD